MIDKDQYMKAGKILYMIKVLEQKDFWISTGIFGKSPYLLKACSNRLDAEPVSVKIPETKRTVKLFSGIIVLYHLEIGVACASFFAFIK